MKEVHSGNHLHRATLYIEQAHKEAKRIIDQMLEAPVWSFSDHAHYLSRLQWLSHGERNANMGMLYIVEFGLPRGIRSSDTLADVNLAFHLHDIGKSEVPDPLIWHKTEDELVPSEREIMKSHVRLADPVFRKFETWAGSLLPAIVHDISLFHHEKLNGSGKPHELVESEIGFFARLGTCVDQIVSRCEERRYHTRTYTLQEAFNEVNSKAGVEFDEDVLQRLGLLLMSDVHMQIPGMAWLGSWEQ